MPAVAEHAGPRLIVGGIEGDGDRALAAGGFQAVNGLILILIEGEDEPILVLAEPVAFAGLQAVNAQGILQEGILEAVAAVIRFGQIVRQDGPGQAGGGNGQRDGPGHFFMGRRAHGRLIDADRAGAGLQVRLSRSRVPFRVIQVVLHIGGAVAPGNVRHGIIGKFIAVAAAVIGEGVAPGRIGRKIGHAHLGPGKGTGTLQVIAAVPFHHNAALSAVIGIMHTRGAVAVDGVGKRSALHVAELGFVYLDRPGDILDIRVVGIGDDCRSCVLAQGVVVDAVMQVMGHRGAVDRYAVFGFLHRTVAGNLGPVHVGGILDDIPVPVVHFGDREGKALAVVVAVIRGDPADYLAGSGVPDHHVLVHGQPGAVQRVVHRNIRVRSGGYDGNAVPDFIGGGIIAAALVHSQRRVIVHRDMPYVLAAPIEGGGIFGKLTDDVHLEHTVAGGGQLRLGRLR